MSNNTINRVALVTGAGMSNNGGLGRGIAAKLAESGITSIMLADIDPKVTEAAAQLARDTGIQTISYVGDLSLEANVKEMVEHTIKAFGRIDVLVNNAGGGIIKAFLDHDAESFTITLARNLWTALWCCHKVLPHMVAQNHGRIINIGADSLRTGIPHHAGYNAAKGGVLGMTVGLAKDFAHLDITVNMVSPCVINTSRFRDSLITNPELGREFLQVIPKGRGAEINEVADLVCFLAKPEAAFMTGQDLSINGGSAMP